MQRDDEGAVIERYLQGKLMPDEQAAFEEAYLSDPDLLEQVELAERLQEGLRGLADARTLGRRGSFRWPAPLGSPLYAAAASVLLVLSLTFSAGLYQSNRALQSSLGAVPRARLERLLTVRGNEVNEITAPAENELVVLLVDAGPEYESYRVTVSRQQGPAGSEVVWQAQGLEPGYEESLAIAVPGRALRPGDYTVAVEPSAGQTGVELSRFQVTVLAPGPTPQ